MARRSPGSSRRLSWAGGRFVLGEQLIVGEAYTLRFEDPCPAEGSYPEGVEPVVREISFTAGPATPLPTQFGQVSVAYYELADVPASVDSECKVEYAHAVVAHLQVDLSPELAAYFPVTSFRSSAPRGGGGSSRWGTFETWPPLPAHWQEPDADWVFADCNGFYGAELGPQTVQVTATVAASPPIQLVASVDVNFDCDPAPSDGGTMDAADVGTEDGGTMDDADVADVDSGSIDAGGQLDGGGPEAQGASPPPIADAGGGCSIASPASNHGYWGVIGMIVLGVWRGRRREGTSG